jgi:hypothetical protein
VGRSFRRAIDGSLHATLDRDEVDVLGIVMRDIAQVITEPPNDDISGRLYPRAYLDPTADEAEEEFQGLVHDDLRSGRLAALATVSTTIDAAVERSESAATDAVELVLSPDEDMLWLTALNDARLVIGTVLGVKDDEHEFAPDDPRAELIVVYEWLGFLQGELVEVLLDEIGEAGADD